MLKLHNPAKKLALLAAAALLAGLPAGAGVAASRPGHLYVTVTPGDPLAITATPASVTISQPNPTPPCLTVSVTTPIDGWSLAAYYTTAPAHPAVSVSLIRSNTCSTSTSGGTTTSLSSTQKTTVLSNQNGTETQRYYLSVKPVVPRVTVMLTFEVTAPGAPAGDAAVKVALTN